MKDPDSHELADSIHKTALELQQLLNDVALKFEGLEGERWAREHLIFVDIIVEETAPKNRG